MNTSTTQSPQHHAAFGWMLVAVPIFFTAFFTLLQIRFDYPDILRMPAPVVLERFAEQSQLLTGLWYGMTASALLFLPLAVLSARALPRWSLSLLTTGSLAGLVQAVGLSRWVFAVPAIASAYADPHTSLARREALIVSFETLNNVLGVGIGEHLGYTLTAAWTLIVCRALATNHRILAAFGALCGLGILAGLLEPAGLSWAGPVNAIGYSLWSLWLIVLGVFVLRRKLRA